MMTADILNQCCCCCFVFAAAYDTFVLGAQIAKRQAAHQAASRFGTSLGVVGYQSLIQPWILVSNLEEKRESADNGSDHYLVVEQEVVTRDGLDAQIVSPNTSIPFDHHFESLLIALCSSW